jgi:hypothetical protein
MAESKRTWRCASKRSHRGESHATKKNDKGHDKPETSSPDAITSSDTVLVRRPSYTDREASL